MVPTHMMIVTGTRCSTHAYNTVQDDATWHAYEMVACWTLDEIVLLALAGCLLCQQVALVNRGDA